MRYSLYSSHDKDFYAIVNGLQFMVFMNFYWFNTKKRTLYNSFGIGGAAFTTTYYDKNTGDIITESDRSIYKSTKPVVGQLTILGWKKNLKTNNFLQNSK